MKHINKLLFIVIVSCSLNSNVIHFDINKQAVYREGNSSINVISIINDSTSELFELSWNSTTKKAPEIIYINALDTGYKILHMTKKNTSYIKFDKLKLSCNSIYNIEHQVGDRAGCRIKVYTDKFGKVIKAIE